MRIFHDPVTMMAATGLAISAAGAVAGGLQAKAEGDAQAEELKAQAKLERTALQRDLRDERQESKRQLARTRAMLSVGGSGAFVSLASAQQRESFIRQQRMATDSEVRRTTLGTRAANTRRAGNVALGMGMAQGTSSLLSGGARISKYGA